jgi:hemin uptake protein HemP
VHGWQVLASKLAGTELTLSLNISNTILNPKIFKGTSPKFPAPVPRPTILPARNSFLENDMDHNSRPQEPSADFGGGYPDTTNIKLHEYDSSDLLRGAKEVLIRHAGETYRLRLTRNDKLILQK